MQVLFYIVIFIIVKAVHGKYFKMSLSLNGDHSLQLL